MKTSELPVTFFLATLLSLHAYGQTFQVTTNTDGDTGSLRDAMISANASGGGTIVFTNVSGIIRLQSTLPTITCNLTIVGNGPTNVAVDGNQTYRIFNVSTGATLNVSGLTVERGFASSLPNFVQTGAAILSAGALSISNCFFHDNGTNPFFPNNAAGAVFSSESVVLNDVIFSNNIAHWPTHVFRAPNVTATNCLFIKNDITDASSVRVDGDSAFNNCTFAGNIARLTGEGGGIGCIGGNLTLLNCYVTNNVGQYHNGAGGIYFQGPNLTISNCVIDNNVSDACVGGIKADGSEILILNSSISSNQGSNDCGGMNLSADTVLNGCIIASNTSVLNYPAVANSWVLMMTNCTISGNAPRLGVGAAIQNSDTIQSVNCTIAFNGYGVKNLSGGLFFALNTLIAKNGSGPTNGDFSGILTSQGNNLIGNLNTNTTIVGSTNGDIYGLDPLLGPLRNNGGHTLTHALIKGSPAIDTGANTGAPPTDQRRLARPYGPAVDVGAFESEYNLLRLTEIRPANSTNVHLQAEGLPGVACTFQASSNLLDWDKVFVAGSNSVGVWEYIDQDAASYSSRFYRALINNY